MNDSFARTGLPSLTSLLDIVQDLKGKQVHVIPLRDSRGRALGNHGDTLMHQVFEAILGSLGVERVPAAAAEALILPPNGALLDTYMAPQSVAEYLAHSPDVPLFIFPSSSRFLQSDPAQIFAGRRSRTTWISRERYSHEHLTNDWGQSLSEANVDLVLDHDVVASGNSFVGDLFPDNRPRNSLIVARLDAEAGTLARNRIAPSRLRRSLVSLYHEIPSDSVRRQIRRRVTTNRQSESNSRILAALVGKPEDGLFETQPHGLNVDISSPDLVSYERYKTEISCAESVITNRLHVALPAAVLGRRVWLVESGYHKLRGVYEQSLTKLPNVNLISRE